MPVFMVKADTQALEEQPSWQVDLHKIYSEDSSNNAQDFIEQSLAKPSSWLAGALFNDHLLGAVLVTELADSWQLSHLSIRKVTQRRGVATRLLNLLAAQAREKNLALSVVGVEENTAAQALLTKLGFQKASDTESWVLK